MCKDKVELFGRCNDGEMVTGDLNYHLVKSEGTCKRCEDAKVKHNERSVGINMVTFNEETDLEDAFLICPCGMLYKIQAFVKKDIGLFVN